MVSLYDVEQLVRKILASASASVSAQQDGTLVSDGHRSLNFIGPGAIVSDDPAMRRTNVFIPGSPTSSSTVNAPSALTTKTLPLWNSGTSSNDPPPTNWQTTGFADSGWASSTVPTGSPPNPIAGSTSIWYHSSADPAVGVAALFRTHFTLPAGTVASATLTYLADSTAPGIYVNGTFIASQPFFNWAGTLVPYVYAISPSLLVTGGGDNVIATEVVNDPTDLGGQVNYVLAVSMAAAGTDTRYQLLSEKDAVSGYAGLNSSGLVPSAELGSGTPSSSNFLRGDRTWAAASVGSGGIAAAPYILIEDQKTQNTNGGTFTSGADRVRDLNTIVSDASAIASLSSNQITLPAGTYRFRIVVPASIVDRHQAFLYNVTDSTVVKRGSSEDSPHPAGSQTSSIIAGRTTIAASKVFEVRHRGQTTEATDGFGVAANFGTEVYTICEFWQEA